MTDKLLLSIEIAWIVISLIGFFTVLVILRRLWLVKTRVPKNHYPRKARNALLNSHIRSESIRSLQLLIMVTLGAISLSVPNVGDPLPRVRLALRLGFVVLGALIVTNVVWDWYDSKRLTAMLEEERRT